VFFHTKPFKKVNLLLSLQEDFFSLRPRKPIASALSEFATFGIVVATFYIFSRQYSDFSLSGFATAISATFAIPGNSLSCSP